MLQLHEFGVSLAKWLNRFEIGATPCQAAACNYAGQSHHSVKYFQNAYMLHILILCINYTIITSHPLIYLSK